MRIYGQMVTRNADENYRVYRITSAEQGNIEGDGRIGLTLHLKRCSDDAKEVTHPIIGKGNARRFLDEAGVKEAKNLEGRAVLGLLGQEDQVIGVSLGAE